MHRDEERDYSREYRHARDDYQQTELWQQSRTVDPAALELDKKEVERADRIQNENWIRSYWRPGMGWLYMLICFADFVFFPLLAMIIPAILKNFGVENATYVPWTSLTLSNGGLIHLSFGAILGVTAWTRGLEKLRTDRRDS